MLCPVCNENPLTGRQSTCGTRCRSARYRERQRQQRDTSQQPAQPDAATPVSGRHQPQRRSSDAKKLEQLVSAAAARIVEAIEQQGDRTAQQARDAFRVNLREQLTSQAPKHAAGYRLVLPGRYAADPPRLSPKRSRSRDVAWYSLGPFEYPDDIRLCDGFWYRVVWVDAQGRRIRLRPGESVPGLYYFVGPTQPRSHISANTGAATREPQPLGAANTPASQSPLKVGTAATETRSTATVVETAPISAAVLPSAPSSEYEELTDELLNQIARDVNAEIDREEAARLKRLGQVSGGLAALVVGAPPPPAQAPPETWTALLASFPPITIDECVLLNTFVISPALMLQLRYEEQLAESKASGRPAPREPTTLISNDNRQHVHTMFTGRSLPPHFWSRCKAVFEYVRQHGVDALVHLPMPMPPLPKADQRWIEAAISRPAKRTYMHFVCARQDAQLSDQPLPAEPQVPLSSKDRNQIRRAMQDLRAVMFFKRSVASQKV